MSLLQRRALQKPFQNPPSPLFQGGALESPFEKEDLGDFVFLDKRKICGIILRLCLIFTMPGR